MFELIRAHFNALMGNCISRLCRHNFEKSPVSPGWNQFAPECVVSQTHLESGKNSSPLCASDLGLHIWKRIPRAKTFAKLNRPTKIKFCIQQPLSQLTRFPCLTHAIFPESKNNFLMKIFWIQSFIFSFFFFLLSYSLSSPGSLPIATFNSSYYLWTLESSKEREVREGKRNQEYILQWLCGVRGCPNC